MARQLHRKLLTGGFSKGRLIFGLVLAVFALMTYMFNTSENPITGEKQRVALTVDQEVALGLQGREEVARQFGGLDDDPRVARLVKQVGERIVEQSDASKSKYPFEFHVLEDPQTVNAFALPGGQIFITRGLLDKLDSEGQLAGVLGHEVGHVIGRHGAEHLAKAQLAQGLTASAVIASGDYRAGQLAQVVGSLINMKYGRDDELESDAIGVKYMVAAGYDPRSMIRVMEVLEKASGGRSQPEFASTHPNPGNRIERIKEHIQELFPNGVPSNLKP